MAKGGGSNAGRLAVAGGAIVVLVGAFWFFGADFGDEGEVLVEAPEVTASAAETDAGSSNAGAVTEETEPSTAERVASEATAVELPVFDTVRVEADGMMVVAGRWIIGEEVEVVLDITPVVRAEVDGTGQFVAITMIEPSAQPRMLSLVGDPDGARVQSAETILIAPFTTPAPLEPVAEAEGVTESEMAEQAGTDREGEPLGVGEPVSETGETDAESDDTQQDEQVIVAEAVPAAEENVSQEESIEAEQQPVAGADDTVSGAVEQTTEDTVAAVESPAPAETAEAEVADAIAPGTASEPNVPEVEPVAESESADEAAPPVMTGGAEDSTAAEETIAEASEPVADVVGQEAPSAANESAESAEEKEPVIEEETVAESTAPTAPALIVADEEGVRVMTDEIPSSGISVDTISYDLEGRVVVSGRGLPIHAVRIYLDNAPIAEMNTGESGRWEVRLDAVDPGVYTMRVDLVAEDGSVEARIELPFKREEPLAVAAVMARDTQAPEFSGVAVRTVQPGNTLWAISQERYGRGILYVHIFDANRNQIRNPDLIYPGQLFLLPELTDEQLTEQY
ncbi:LysM peptidoglycan-binding domain-containing protein [Pelagovum sp. HNIBRBA483]|uniref:LysM peptidoglycan-binding domain-containing protein n=1 Tax=Pelagovum sp. HNIBRBA483 TaxID=3233341 RepID=UPI0034A53B50